MYLVHDLYAAALARWRQDIPYATIQKAWLKYWPRHNVSIGTISFQGDQLWDDNGVEPGYRSWVGVMEPNAPVVECFPLLGPLIRTQSVLGLLFDNCSDTSLPCVRDSSFSGVTGIMEALHVDPNDLYDLSPTSDYSAWSLNLTNSNDTVTYEEVAEYINRYSELKTDSIILESHEARNRSSRLAKWTAIPDYLNNPPTYVSGTNPDGSDIITPGYADDPNFPLTNVDIVHSRNIAELEEWTEVTISYADRPSAIFHRTVQGIPGSYSYILPGNRAYVESPQKLTNDEILGIVNAGYGATFDIEAPIVDLVNFTPSAYIPGTVDNTHVPGEADLRIKASNAWVNGTLKISSVTGTDEAVMWAALIQQGMTWDSIQRAYTRYPGRYVASEGDLLNQGISTSTDYYGPKELFKTETIITRNTIVVDDGADKTKYFDDFTGKYYYGSRYLRKVEATFRFRRIGNPLDTDDLNATVVAEDDITKNFYGLNLSGQIYTYPSRYACVAASSDIMTNFYSSKSSLDTSIGEAIQRIQGPRIANDSFITGWPEGLTYPGPKSFNKIPQPADTTGDQWISVEKFAAMPPKEAGELILRTIDIYTVQSKASFGDKLISVVSTVLSFIVVVVAAMFNQWWVVTLVLAAYTVTMAYLAKISPLNSQMLGTLSSMVGMAMTFMGIARLLSGFSSKITVAKEVAAKEAGNTAATAGADSGEYFSQAAYDSAYNASMASSSSLTSMVSGVYDGIIDSVTGYAKSFVSNLTSGSIGSTLSAMSQALDFLTSAYKAYVKVISPYEEPLPTNDNTDAVNPVTPTTYEDMMALNGGESLRGIFEFPEEIDASYPRMSHSGMCDALLNKHYDGSAPYPS